MKRRLLKLFTIVGAITTGLFLLMLTVSMLRCAFAEEVEEHTVLELRLDAPLGEGPPSPFAAIFGGGHDVADVLAALERAGEDENIEGVVAWIGDGGGGLARVQDLRDGIARLRAKGKWVVCHAETFGELGPGNQGYYLATACDEIWLQPTGGVGLTGLMSQSMFVRGTLDLVGIEARGDHRKEF
jgi:protease-4